MSNLTCYDSDGNTLKGLYQWDYNQTVTLSGVDFSNVKLVHFANHKMKEALVLEITEQGDSQIKIDIPNIILQFPDPIMIYFYKDSGNDGYRTMYTSCIPIFPRPKPQDYVLTDNVEYMDWVKVADEARALMEQFKKETLALTEDEIDAICVDFNIQ